MTTIINTPSPTTSDSEGNNSLVGVVAVVLLVGLLFFGLFYFGLPALRSLSSPSLSIPSKIDVNVKSGSK